MTNKSNLIDRL